LAAAKALEQDLVAQLKPLAMERVKFKVEVQSQAPTANGADLIAFMFSPNPGEPLQPLVEIASGGEMSRFLLALKACFSRVDPIGTMVFDEIDVGVSGRVAQAIAEKLHQLSRNHQVLCVTHQPLIAAMADAHYHVGKHVITSPSATDKKGRKSVSAKVLAGQNGSQPAAIPTEEAKARAKVAMQAAGQTSGQIAKESGQSVSQPGALAAPEERTIVKVTPLDANSRRNELAQLAGGRSHSEAIAFADSLLIQAETIRKAG
jgi:DNA repair protein RecN (Recombination protein N)